MKSGERNKAEGDADKTKGKLKEGVGKFAGDREIESEGKADQSKGHSKKAVGEVKKAFGK